MPAGKRKSIRPRAASAAEVNAALESIELEIGLVTEIIGARFLGLREAIVAWHRNAGATEPDLVRFRRDIDDQFFRVLRQRLLDLERTDPLLAARLSADMDRLRSKNGTPGLFETEP